MDLQTLDVGIKVTNLFVTLAVGLYVWLTSRNRVTHARITELQEKTSKSIDDLKEKTSKGLNEIRSEMAKEMIRLDSDVDRRLEGSGEALARLEEALKQAPNREELRQIHLRINDVSEQVSNIGGEFSGVKNTLNLIHEYLLKGPKK